MRKVLFYFVTAAIAASIVASVFAGGHECQITAEECAKKLRAAYEKAGWLGIDMEKGPGGVIKVTAVTPNSPAAAAGFAAGDVLVAVNGVAFAEKGSAAWKRVQGLEPGRRVEYSVLRDGTPLTLSATLAATPEPVIDRWIKEHVAKEHRHRTDAST